MYILYSHLELITTTTIITACTDIAIIITATMFIIVEYIYSDRQM